MSMFDISHVKTRPRGLWTNEEWIGSDSEWDNPCSDCACPICHEDHMGDPEAAQECFWYGCRRQLRSDEKFKKKLIALRSKEFVCDCKNEINLCHGQVLARLATMPTGDRPDWCDPFPWEIDL